MGWRYELMDQVVTGGRCVLAFKLSFFGTDEVL